MPVKTVNLPLSIIKIDGGTQQRDIDMEIMKRYAELMKDGVEFPPVELVNDGKNYYLTDGFTRYFAAKEAGVKMLKGNVITGTLRDAIWKSLAANKLHGYPRSGEALRNIIEKIFKDDEWKIITHKQIAEHVGVSRGHVGRILKSIDDEKTPVTLLNEPHRTKDVKKSQVPEKEKTNEKSGQSTPSENQKKIVDTEKPVVDAVGNIVPKNLREIFLNMQKIKDITRKLDNFKDDTLSAVHEDPKLWHYFRENPFATDVENIKRILKFSMPHSVCPYCHGKAPVECGCKGAGYVNKEMFDARPDKNKNPK